ncbi:MAG: motility associated factor glycosyltransferase family protein, partial [Spirochaetales bacterium]|nr:motility associated factor glycosyltransferase family protein [Spirochaetales bacterium]
STEIIIVEPSIRFFASTLFYRDMSQILADKKITFLLEASEDQILGSIAMQKSDKFPIIKNINILKLNSNFFEKIEKQIDDLKKTIAANRSTAKKFKTLWIKNTIRNMEDFSTAVSPAILTNRFAGLPAIVLGAGPSLNKVLPKIKELQEKALIIAVDTALRGLTSHGVVPDFFLISDPQYWNIRHLDNTDTAQSILITSSEAVALFPKSKFSIYSSSSFPICKKIEELLKPGLPSLRSGGSVITSAWDLAQTLGCNQIFLAGIDFSYPDCQTHYHDSRFESLALANSNRFSPFTTYNFATVNARTTYYDYNYLGNKIKSDKRLSIYKWWFERQFESSNLKSFNLESDGLAIKNLKNVEIKAILDFPDSRKKIDSTLVELKTEILKNKGENSFKKNTIHDFFSQEIAIIEDILNSSDKSFKDLPENSLSKEFFLLNLDEIRDKSELLRKVLEDLKYFRFFYEKIYDYSKV